MKRSEINTLMRDAESFITRQHFYLPAFARWTPDDWTAKGVNVKEIAQHHLGWDITDFGLGDYHKTGLLLFTIRNGDPANLKTGTGKTYAEKILLIDVDQMTPYHFHWLKTEDIINRGGGQLMIQLYNSTPTDGLADTEIVISLDGVEQTLPAGAIVALQPGESITLPTRLYHKFWATDGRVLAGEVSVVNDDFTDNRFYEPIGRFPTIEEDAAPLYLLSGDYAKYYRH